MKIRQRKKGDPITVDGRIPIHTHKQEGSTLPFLTEPIAVKITASEKDWQVLFNLAEGDPEYLGNLIHIHIARPVYEKYLHRLDYPPSRGIQSKPEDKENPCAISARQKFMWKAQSYAVAAYTILSYWKRKHEREWPQHLKNLIAEAEASIGFQIVWNCAGEKKCLNVIDVVIYLFEKQYNSEIKQLGIVDTDTRYEDSFINVYLPKQRRDTALAIFNSQKPTIEITELYNLLL